MSMAVPICRNTYIHPIMAYGFYGYWNRNLHRIRCERRSELPFNNVCKTVHGLLHNYHGVTFSIYIMYIIAPHRQKMYAPQNNQAQRRPKFESRSTTFIITPTTTILLMGDRGLFLSLFEIVDGTPSHHSTRTSQNSLN